MGQDIPLPDKRANGRPHTVLGGKVSSKTGEVYRQSATFNGGSWPTANAHSNPHQHVFMYDFDNRYWHRSDQEILNQEDNKLDYSIVFKLKQIDLEEVGITERFTSWGEKDFSYSPRRFKGYGDIQLIEVEEPMEIEGSIELKVIGIGLQ